MSEEKRGPFANALDALEQDEMESRKRGAKLATFDVRAYHAGSIATTSCLGCGAHVLLDGNNCKHCGAPPQTFKLFTGDER